MKKKFKNLFEKRINLQLKRSKLKFKYECERIPYVLAGHYIPDFIVETINGKIYIECKGYLRPASKAKMVAVRRQHPEIDLRIVFYEKRKSNIRWAEKIGIKWAVGTIPTDWLKGL